jgi:hypothetical protein
MKDVIETLKIMVLGIAFFALVCGVGWLMTFRYRECREHGFSVLYCVTSK